MNEINGELSEKDGIKRLTQDGGASTKGI